MKSTTPFKLILYCLGVIYFFMLLTSCTSKYYQYKGAGAKELRQLRNPERV
jgi:hypothetical protein